LSSVSVGKGAGAFGPPEALLDVAAEIAVAGAPPPAELTEAARVAAPMAAQIAPARARAGIEAVIMGKALEVGLQWMHDAGLLAVLLPELEATVDFSQEAGRRHKDVWEHTKQVVQQSVPKPLVRWAALLHDIGKPATRRFESDGRVTFHHHEAVGARMARVRLRALRYSKEIVDDVAQLVFLHLRFYGYGRGEWTDSAVRRYVVDAGPLLDRLHKLVRSDCTTRNQRKAAALSSAYDALEARIALLREKEELDSIRPDLDGNEIMAVLGIPPGPTVGRAYQHLLALRMEHGPLGHDRAVEELKKWAAEQQ